MRCQSKFVSGYAGMCRRSNRKEKAEKCLKDVVVATTIFFLGELVFLKLFVILVNSNVVKQ